MKRQRSLVCGLCRQRKSRCDKATPCSNCVRLGKASSCTYDQEAIKRAMSRADQPYIASAQNPLVLTPPPTSLDESSRADSHALQAARAAETAKTAELEILKLRLKMLEDTLRPAQTTSIPSSTLPGVYGERQGQRDAATVLSQPLNGSIEGPNPFGSTEDTINFYEGYTSIHIKQGFRRVSFGPFTWSAIMQKDPWLKLLWDHTTKTKLLATTALIFTNRDDMGDETTSVLTSNDQGSEKLFEKRLLEPEGVRDLIPYCKLLGDRQPRQATKQASHVLESHVLGKQHQQARLAKDQEQSRYMSLGLSYGKVSKELALIDKLEVYLPKQRVVWELVDIYFRDVYPFLAFLDQNCFETVLETLVGPRGYQDRKISAFKIERKLDLAYFGMLFIMLRLSYLTLFHNTKEYTIEEINDSYLLSHPISIDFVDVAQECLDQFNMFRVPSLPVLQLAMFLKFYHTYAPEDGDGADGGDAISMISLLVQMATSFGCHREPDNIEQLNKRDPINSNTRKIWHYVVCYDLKLGWTFGQPVGIARGSYDTKIPFYRRNEECLYDKEFDKFIIENLFTSPLISDTLRRFLSLILNVEAKVRIQEVCLLLTELETALKAVYGSLENCLAYTGDKYQEIRRSYKTKNYLEISSFTININFNLYQYYENKDPSISFYYIKKILVILVSEFTPRYFDILGIGKLDLFVTPSLEQFIHKSNLILFSLLIKTNFTLHGLRNALDHTARLSDPQYLHYYKLLGQFASCMTRCLEVSIAVISKISNRYYYAWRITKGHTTLLDIATNQEFFEANFANSGYLTLQVLTAAELQELVAICEAPLTALGKTLPLESLKSLAPSEPSEPQAAENDFDFVSLKEIDRLWIQMLNFKEDFSLPAVDEMFGPAA